MQYPDSMDPECIPLCDALNALPGIATHESCCGHGRGPHRIWFSAATIESLQPVLEIVRENFDGVWRVEAGWANGSCTVYFKLEGPVGSPDAPSGANELAARLVDLQKSTPAT